MIQNAMLKEFRHVHKKISLFPNIQDQSIYVKINIQDSSKSYLIVQEVVGDNFGSLDLTLCT